MYTIAGDTYRPHPRAIVVSRQQQSHRTGVTLVPYASGMPPLSFDQALSRGIAAHQAGRFDDAAASYRQALALAPDDAEAQSLLGLALAQGGAPQDALPWLRQAVAREPRESGFRLNLAEGLERTGDAAGALAELRRVLAEAPGHPRAAAHAARIATALSDWAGLEAIASGWTRASPGHPEAWRQLARAAFESGFPRRAMEAFARLLPLSGRQPADLAAYAGLCLHALDLDAAEIALEAAAAADPDQPDLLARQGLLHLYHGRFEQAEACCRRCLALDPENVAAFTTLSRVLGGALDPASQATLARVARDPARPFDHRIPAAFAVAHAHDARGEIDQAFAAYQGAHALALERDRLEGRRFDVAAESRRAARLRAQLPPQPDAIAPAATKPRFVFIVGMPRSGTTLVESLFGAHSRVWAGGERPAMRQVLRAWLALDAAGREADPATLASWAEACRRDLPDTRGAEVVTDKHPLNFEAAGLIARLFPDALILNLRRNPLETGLSIYRQEFSKHWSFAQRLEDIGRFYGQYARLAAHWERVLPGRFVTIQYEALAGDFATQAPALLARAGLDWEPGCAQFQSARRAIATFSTVQAREPVANRNGRAARYAAHLAPLVASLEAEGIDLGTGALREDRVGGEAALVQD